MSSLILISSCVISKSLRDTLESRPVVKAIDTHFHTIQCSASRSPWHPRDWRHSENRDTHFFSGGITYLLSAATVLWLKRKVRIVLQQCVVCTFYNKSFTSMTWGSMCKGEAGGGGTFPYPTPLRLWRTPLGSAQCVQNWPARPFPSKNSDLQLNPKIIACTKEMVFQRKLLEKPMSFSNSLTDWSGNNAAGQFWQVESAPRQMSRLLR